MTLDTLLVWTLVAYMVGVIVEYPITTKETGRLIRLVSAILFVLTFFVLLVTSRSV